VPGHDTSAFRYLAAPQGNPAKSFEAKEIVPAAYDEPKHAATELDPDKRNGSRTAAPEPYPWDSVTF
jgi:hypothetical protein